MDIANLADQTGIARRRFHELRVVTQGTQVNALQVLKAWNATIIEAEAPNRTLAWALGGRGQTFALRPDPNQARLQPTLVEPTGYGTGPAFADLDQY